MSTTLFSKVKETFQVKDPQVVHQTVREIKPSPPQFIERLTTLCEKKLLPFEYRTKLWLLSRALWQGYEPWMMRELEAMEAGSTTKRREMPLGTTIVKEMVPEAKQTPIVEVDRKSQAWKENDEIPF